MHFQSSIKDLRDRSKKMSKHILQENYERFFGKREFGDPLPTFKGVMEKHQVNKLNEDWWDNMSPEDQAEYIKAHPTSQKAQASKEEPKEKPSDRYADVDTSWMDDPEAAAAQGTPGYTTDDNWGREKGYGQPGHKSYEYIPKSKDDSEGDFPKDPDDIDDLPDEESSGRTGKELNQETLTINGKQFRILNESVEKQPKPKYEFSEFYQRFKRQE